MNKNAVTAERNCQPEGRLALTLNETASLLGVKPITVYRLVKRGLINKLPIRHIRIPRTEIDRFLQASVEGTQN